MLGLAVAASGCKASEKSAGRTRLALNWVAEPEFGGFYAARDTGAFSRAGLDVDIMTGGAGAPVIQMVATGQAEFGIASGDELVVARAAGVDIIPLFAVYQTSPLAIMAHASRGAKSIADVLASGSLAVEPGSPYVAFLKKKHGFDKVSIVPYDGGVARFLIDKDHAQQCFITSEPIAARRKGADPKVFLVAEEGFAPYAAVLITRKALWKEKPEQVRAFVRAVREGWRSYLDNPEPANAVMGKLNTSMDAETFRAVSAEQKPLIDDGKTKLGAMTRDRWDTLAKQLLDLGIIKVLPPTDDYLITIEE